MADLRYSHQWEAGDVLISDNLAVLHEAHEDTQAPREAVGLRVMHRTTVVGAARPASLRAAAGGGVRSDGGAAVRLAGGEPHEAAS